MSALVLNMNLKNIFEKIAHGLFGNTLTNTIASKLYLCAQFLSRKLGVRSRHILTKNNHLRFRYVAGISTFMMAAILSFTFTAQNSSNGTLSDTSIALQLATMEPAAGQPDISRDVVDTEFYQNFEEAALVSNEVLTALPLDREITIKSGDALSVVMEKQGVGNSDTFVIMEEMKKYYDPRHIKAGQKIGLHFEETEDDQPVFREMKINLDPIKTLVVARAGEGFKAELHKKEVKKVIKAKKAEVKISLYGSAAQAGIPKSVVAKAIKIFSWDVDFQRDIRPSDTLEVMYESYETDSGYVSKTGDILYTKLKIGKREVPLYRFTMSDGRTDYFQPNGRSIKHTLMKTPINGARMSSGFGKRRHPVLGYTKMHKGVDFAASRGTPIFAAGDGVVEKSGWFSSYGKYVRIRHNSKLKTAYAHMSKIKPAVKQGRRVKQGQVIGYVGTTGRSTGPHLHYEVMVNGTQVNPRSVNLPTGEDLSGTQLANFKAKMNRMQRQYASKINATKVASSEATKESIN